VALDGRKHQELGTLSIPNTLTLARILLVPVVIWLIIDHDMLGAFVLFLLAGLSDGADGYLAKRYGWRTELGAYLDPMADKALLVSIYVTLGLGGHLPVWLVIAVVSRDVGIVAAVILAWMLSRPFVVHPLLVSKANTLSQIVLAGLVLAELGLGLGMHNIVAVFVWVTGALTLLSWGAYFWEWLKHMASYEPPRAAVLPQRKTRREPLKPEPRARARAT
jgi:cardiolipin synthase